MLDSEGIVGNYLRNHPDVEVQVLGQFPDTTTKPWVQITLLDASNATGNSKVEHLVCYYLQFDCYAGGSDLNRSQDAFNLAKAIRVALLEAINQSIGGEEEAVVTDVRMTSMPRIPDSKLEPARQRYILEVEVFMRPADEGS